MPTSKRSLGSLSPAGPEDLPAPAAAVVDSEIISTVDAGKGSGHKTAKLAATILCETGTGFSVPTAKQRENLLVAFARAGYVIYGKAFDVVRCPADLDLNDPDEILRRLDEVVIYEIKSTNNHRVKADFRAYFFSLSTAELLVAQNLGKHYRFAFVNTRTRTHMELTLREIFARSRGIYPVWAIHF